MPTTKRHLFNLGSLSSSEIEIIKRVNNPDVINVINNEWLNNIDPDIIKQYIEDVVNYWNSKLEISDKNKNKTLNRVIVDFAKARKDIEQFLRSLDKKYKLPRKPSGAVIIRYLRNLFKDDTITAYTLITLMDLLTTKNRYHSGVLEIAIMTGPGDFSCKYDCHYCPNQPGIARSYVKEEPAVRRGAQHDFDCVRQINARISSYLSIGQPGDKGEFIILGGTFSNYSDEYRREFMRDLYYACNTYYDVIKRQRLSLEDEKDINETALFKVIGLTVETRPDCIDEEEILRYISYGVTRVQLGVQHTDDRLLKKINRKCYTKDTIKALTMLKTAGFKVLCHYMPNLPGATPEGDIEMFNNVINNPDLVCDEWKIYPTSVTTTSSKDIEEITNKVMPVYTVIEKWFLDGKYVPYDANTLEEVIRYALVACPKYIRIARVFRDIPIDNIIGGADVPHLRQKLERKMAADGEYCECIRSREIRNREVDISKVSINTQKYSAQGGTEIFISADYYDPNEDKTFLVGFCRLRINQNNGSLDYLPHLKNSAIVRELHVYGKMVPSYFSKVLTSNTQHKGIGSRLMREAESITANMGICKLAVISGVGVRRFYSDKLGYRLQNNYMTKNLHFKVILSIISNLDFWAMVMFIVAVFIQIKLFIKIL